MTNTERAIQEREKRSRAAAAKRKRGQKQTAKESAAEADQVVVSVEDAGKNGKV